MAGGMHAWEVCAAGGVYGLGACVEGGAWYGWQAGGMHPTGMLTCLKKAVL